VGTAHRESFAFFEATVLYADKKLPLCSKWEEGSVSLAGSIETFSAWVIRVDSDAETEQVLAAAVDGAWNGYRQIYLLASHEHVDSSLEDLLVATKSAVNDHDIKVTAIRFVNYGT
jgi:hypothetical protein